MQRSEDMRSAQLERSIEDCEIEERRILRAIQAHLAQSETRVNDAEARIEELEQSKAHAHGQTKSKEASKAQRQARLNLRNLRKTSEVRLEELRALLQTARDREKALTQELEQLSARFSIPTGNTSSRDRRKTSSTRSRASAAFHGLPSPHSTS